MPTETRLEDPCARYFRCLENLQFDENAPLSCRCLGLWKHWAHLDHLGPIMLFADLHRSVLIDTSILPLKKSGQIAPSLELENSNTVQKIILARVLLSMGLLSEAKRVLDQIQNIDTQREKLWVVYLEELLTIAGAKPKEGNTDLESILGYARTPYGPEAILLGLFLLRKKLSCCSKSREFILEIIENSILSSWEKSLAVARLHRVCSESYAITGNEVGAKTSLENVFALVSQAEEIAKITWHQQMCWETKRRVLEYAYRFAKKQKKWQEAIDFSMQIVELDPSCARAHLLAGEAYLKQKQTRKALHHLHYASVLGTLERPYANYLLSQLHEGVTKHHYLTFATHAAFFRKDAHEFVKTKSFPSSIEMVDLQENLYEAGEQKNLAKRVMSDTLLDRFGAYSFLVTSASLSQPMCAVLPEIAWKVFEDCPEPHFVTHFPQRVLVPGFRRELFHASNAWRWISEKDFTGFSSWCHLMGCPDRISLLEENKLSRPYAKAYLARYLVVMGFFDEAKQLLAPKANVYGSSIEQLYEQTLYLWVLHFFETSDCQPFLTQLATHFERIPSSQETLRMRLNIAMLGTVVSAKACFISDCEIWRERALAELKAVQDSSSFSIGEKVLLGSRTFRAICYLPFLRKDQAQLLREREQFLQDAYILSEYSTDIREIFFKDNLFAALETSARIADTVGSQEEALAYMKKIVQTVDPFDAKAWIQLGGLYQKQHHFTEALDSFLQAATLGAPHAHLSYYSAGRCAAELKELELAKHCFLQSALALPGGISPLLQLVAVCEKTSDLELKCWGLESLERLKNSSQGK